ncbi:MAG: hypothetical protein QW292_07285 [Candidatus Parvarchaeota archaeon]
MRIKTSLRKASFLFRILGNVIKPRETIRRYAPPALSGMMESAGYFVYVEQYAHTDGVEKYKALPEDSGNGNFVEEIPIDLKERTLIRLFVRTLLDLVSQKRYSSSLIDIITYPC